ncbi:hypothetical protein chiPu_0012854 [Chiloscyllium punctatum]|uniref:Uncharacterized protein n=1 Tax=Chiloscyllium punctatum TaxID=137246 RepID=A0A401SVG7_CHIPU|nr:hypothetical protein [Chiloscyllium punctatum]
MVKHDAVPAAQDKNKNIMERVKDSWSPSVSAASPSLLLFVKSTKLTCSWSPADVRWTREKKPCSGLHS